jgi:hypothetical protein
MVLLCVLHCVAPAGLQITFSGKQLKQDDVMGQEFARGACYVAHSEKPVSMQVAGCGRTMYGICTGL